MFKIGRKEDGLAKKLEVMNLKFEISSIKILQLEEKVTNFEKRLANVETSNRKLAEAVMNLVEILRDREEKVKAHLGTMAQRQLSQQPYSKRTENFSNQTARVALESQIVEYLKNNGPSTPAQMQVFLNRSREHISRTLKALSENGIVERKKEGRTFIYNLSDAKEEKGGAL